MSDNEKKDNISIKNNDKTNDIINSIQSTVIPNIEETSNKLTNVENYNNTSKNKEEIFYKTEEYSEYSNNNKHLKKNNCNQIKNDINQSLSNNFIDNNIHHNNNNKNYINIDNNVNNIFNNNNLNNINHLNNNINNNLNINQNNQINNNLTNNINNQNNEDNYNNNNIKKNSNNNNDNINVNQNNHNHNFQIPNKNIINRKKSNAEKKSGKKGMKDIAFKFPIKESFSKVEIPFAFQQNLDEPNNNRFHSYITIKDIPKLYIDISNDEKMDKFNLTSNIDTLKSLNLEQEKKLSGIDTNIMKYNEDNESLRKEKERLKNEINSKDNEINKLKLIIKQINEDNIRYENDIKQKINDKNNSYLELKNQYDIIKNEITNKKLNENEQKEYLIKIREKLNIIQKEYQNNFKYYKNKFINNNNYTDEYLKKALQKDLLDFTSYVTQKIQIISPKVKELIKYIQNAVDSSIGKEYEVKLYGSHATGLCLPWSDIDVVLCKKNGEGGEGVEYNSYLPLQELYAYLIKNNDFFKSINYIGTTTIPLIKIKTKENLGIQSVDISLQDKSHYGIKCVSLVLSFKEEYEVLLPMILALKNILKQANLNDPYKVRINLFIYIINNFFLFYRED